MTRPNIEKFNAIVNKAFALLHESFPKPRDLPFAEFVDISNMTKPIIDELTDEAIFCIASLKWLADNGYITIGRYSEDSYMFSEVALTAKGLETLKAAPDGQEVILA